MIALRRISLACIGIGVLLLFAQSQGGGVDPSPTPPPTAELPIDAPGFHFVMVRPRASNMSSELSAVVNSQTLEDEATENGGTYRVYFDNEDTNTMPAAYHDIYQKMRGERLPQFCACDSSTELYEIGEVKPILDDMLAMIRRVRGAR